MQHHIAYESPVWFTIKILNKARVNIKNSKLNSRGVLNTKKNESVSNNVLFHITSIQLYNFVTSHKCHLFLWSFTSVTPHTKGYWVVSLYYTSYTTSRIPNTIVDILNVSNVSKPKPQKNQRGVLIWNEPETSLPFEERKSHAKQMHVQVVSSTTRDLRTFLDLVLNTHRQHFTKFF